MITYKWLWHLFCPIYGKKNMKLANAIEGGITGATTLGLIQEALHKIDPKASRAKLLNSPGIINV